MTELNVRIKNLIESRFGRLWISAEVSGISRPRSGHLYFTLADPGAQVKGVIWRSDRPRMGFDPEEGMKVLVAGKIDVYTRQGNYQVVVDHLEPVGVGPLQLAFERLHRQLKKEGLFERRHKKPLPRFPGRVGIVTSPDGAALRDILEMMSRKVSATAVVIPVRVQGDGAAEEIARAIRDVNAQRLAIDVLIVGRGGGSPEDLAAFNEEVLARAIFASRIPVISAVGHEKDTTIADLVADARALTPTDAGEMVLPARQDVAARLEALSTRMGRSLIERVRLCRSRLDGLAHRPVLRDGTESIRLRERTLDELGVRLESAVAGRLDRSVLRMERTGALLESLSPLAILSRGYSVTLSADRVVRSSTDVGPGDVIRTVVSRGTIWSEVTHSRGKDS